ncbi:MAG TPA: DNA primase [Acidobacteriota bacterium]|nr:DNA primase [Acidobacteriota bacterium]HQF86962.1 DNA primase [Acidobacteriota bacterium]HQG91240.1 DNA primase [Acidobacteriota bacterium]
MRISSQFVQQLKHTLNIVEVAGNFLKLTRKGKNYFALCPFHTEKTPSFSINEQLQSYHCFGCGKGGDVIQLVMELENLTYSEAIHFLADLAHLRVPALDPAEEKRYRDREHLQTVMAEASKFYQRCLKDPEGAGARDYLDGRQIAPGTIQRFMLGFAPGDGQRLVSYLRGLGIREPLAQHAGLVRVSEVTQRSYDLFRSRLIVPIQDMHGRVIAFGGRILGEGEPKYLNSPETPLYQKGYHLFGLGHALKAIRQADLAILVEGYFDMIVPFQAGVENVVASLGTGLTPAQVKLLGRFTRNIVICFDPDTAGANAAFRSVELFLENEFDCRVATLPGGHDPDTFVLKHGADSFREAVKQSLPFLDFQLHHKLQAAGADLSVERKVKILESMFPFLARIQQEPIRSNYLTGWADRLGIHRDALFNQYNAFARSRKVDKSVVAQYSQSPLTAAETELINFMLHFPEMAPKIFSGVAVTFEGLATSNILTCIAQQVQEGGAFRLAEIENMLTESDRTLLHQVMSRATTVVTETEAVNCLLSLRQRSLEQELERLTAECQQAEQSGDMDRCRGILERRKRIIMQLNK